MIEKTAQLCYNKLHGLIYPTRQSERRTFMTYKINFARYANHFALPKDIVDESLCDMDDVYLKVILLIFKQPEKECSVHLLSHLLDKPEKKIEEAISYWISRGLLVAQNAQKKADVVVLSQKVASHPAPNLSVTPEAKYLLQCIESLLSRPVTAVESKTVIQILEYLKMPADVVLMAVDYCVSIGKMSARYLEKTCAAWADNGILTHDLAEQYLTFLKQSKSHEAIIRKITGIETRNFTENEKTFIRRWFDEYQFDEEMITLAYERMIRFIGKISFPYLNTILTSWFEKGYRHPEDINEEKREKVSSISEKPTYDLDELERFWEHAPDMK